MTEHPTSNTPPAPSITEADREDLLVLLEMRFGPVPQSIRNAVQAVDDFSRIDHLILVAANARGWKEFAAEAQDPGFRIVGQHFDPLGNDSTTKERKGNADGE